MSLSEAGRRVRQRLRDIDEKERHLQRKRDGLVFKTNRLDELRWRLTRRLKIGEFNRIAEEVGSLARVDWLRDRVSIGGIKHDTRVRYDETVNEMRRTVDRLRVLQDERIHLTRCPCCGGEGVTRKSRYERAEGGATPRHVLLCLSLGGAPRPQRISPLLPFGTPAPAR